MSPTHTPHEGYERKSHWQGADILSRVLQCPSSCSVSLSECLFDLVQLLRVFHPILHITAITANIADHWNFTEQGHPCGIDVVPTGVSCRMIRHTHDIFRMALWAAPCIFHRQSLLVTTSKTQHSVSKAAAHIQRAGGHIPTRAAASSIISGTRYLRG